MSATTIRLPTAVMSALDAAAERDTRSRSQQIAHYVRLALESEGRLPPASAVSVPSSEDHTARTSRVE